MLRHHLNTQPTDGLFATCSAKDLAAIRRAGTEVSVPAGAVIHEHGHRADWAYVILDGRAVVTDRNREQTLVPGDVHGARALLAHDDWCGQLRALTPLRLLVIDRRHFTGLMIERASFGYGIARHLAVA